MDKAIRLAESLNQVIHLARAFNVPKEALIHTIEKVWIHSDTQEAAKREADAALEKVRTSSKS